ncbi:hypothetical protein [Candidatus Uabimicrobium sp. HlEnr_7]|uniref:hypothetical protein n=1 Tax=Candidatus Uabimicrobium helgolandensis TaxID=3095367 RepID=UPI00355707EF
MKTIVLVLIAFCIIAAPTHSLTEEFTVDSSKSLLSVLVQKAGVASYLAHNHLVYAYKFDTTLNYDHRDQNQTTFSTKIKTNNLYADYQPLSEKWYPTFKKLGILSEKFTKLSDSDRKKVRINMQSSSQLDSKNHSHISAKVVEIKNKETKIGEVTFTKMVKLSLTIKGKTITKEIPGNMILKDNVLSVKVLGKYKFSEFGITPYSALLGAIRNKDDFHLYVSLHAKGNSKK